MGSALSNDPPIEPIDVPDTEPGYPPPSPPLTRKEEIYTHVFFQALDTRAQEAPESLNSSYSALMDYLMEGVVSDLQKVRAVFAWLSAQQIEIMRFPKVKNAYSPEGYMKLIQQGEGTYTGFFALLCRAAGLPCVVVRGVAKAAGYEVGQQGMVGLHSLWNAVWVDGTWRLVHPYWAAVELKGFQPGGWTKVEENGQSLREAERVSSGKKIYTTDEFWFLTDPEQFVYFCLASKPEWQLLKQPWELSKFVNVPQFTKYYFGCGLTLTSQHAAILKSHNGRCDISLGHSEFLDAALDYSLYFDDRSSEHKLRSALQLDKYVIRFGDERKKCLRIRFPVAGIYKIKVTGVTDSRHHICSFRLECDQVPEDTRPYPSNPAIGFGVGKAAEEVGLVNPSQKNGLVVVNPGETAKFHFKCTEELDLEANLLHREQAASDLASNVNVEQADDDVTIAVKVPEHARDPEYALEVNAKPKGAKGPRKNVANYLLSSGREEPEGNDECSGYKREDSHGKHRNHKLMSIDKGTTEEPDSRRKLVDAARQDDIERLEKAIQDFEKAKLPDLGEKAKARNRLYQLHEAALRQAIKSRSADRLDEVIRQALQSHVAFELYGSDVMKEAEDVRRQLRRLRLYMHKVLQLEPMTVSEIYSYHRPRPLVHEVMKATFLLLGEKEQQLEQWEFIQSLLRKQGRESIIRRIKAFDIIDVEHETRESAERLLRHCNKFLVRQTSAGAGTFYKWSKNIVNEAKKLDNRQKFSLEPSAVRKTSVPVVDTT